MTTILQWLREHILIATCFALAASYFIGFRIYYCAHDGCTHPANWWFHLTSEAQAAWVGSLGTIFAVWWGFVLFWRERTQKRKLQQMAARPAAYALIDKIEAIERQFQQVNLIHPEAPRILAIMAKHGKLKLDFVAVDDSLALLQDDEIAAIDQLNTAIEEFSRTVNLCGRDSAYGGTTGDDLFIRAKKTNDYARKTLLLFRSRYVITTPRVRVLEASDSSFDGDQK